jgi:hypothetical protein
MSYSAALGRRRDYSRDYIGVRSTQQFSAATTDKSRKSPMYKRRANEVF